MLKSLLQKYQWVVFDADETLFHFDSQQGLVRMFAHYAVDFSAADFTEYQAVNQPLWVAYQNGTIGAQALQERRFNQWGKRLQVAPAELNHAFLNAMAEICAPLDGAAELMQALHGRVKMGIITNGFTQLQQVRLQSTGFLKYFDAVVISEQVGVAKPDRKIFDHALSLMGGVNAHQVLMVGDTAESDILGGMNAGWDTCWLNAHDKPLPEQITPTYQVNSLAALRELLVGASV